MRYGRMEWTVIAPLDLLAMSKRSAARQFMSHVCGGHSQKNWYEKDCGNKKQ